MLVVVVVEVVVTVVGSGLTVQTTKYLLIDNGDDPIGLGQQNNLHTSQRFGTSKARSCKKVSATERIGE